MASTQINIKEWLDKFRSGTISEAEKGKLRTYIKSTYKDEQLDELMNEHWNSLGQLDMYSDKPDLSFIKSKLISLISEDQSKSIPLFKDWKIRLMRVAAVLFIPMLLVSAYLFYRVYSDQSGINQLVMQEVMATPGSRVHFTLPDKTEVWLNSASKLEYPVSIGNSSKRVVKLYGQGYFKVAPDKKRPFIVKAGELNIQVLGTSFDVSNYRDDLYLNATLEEGKIAMLSPDGRQIASLVPGQRASLNKSTREFSIEKMDTRTSTSWKDGVLIFDDTSLAEVAKQLARWYNCDIELQKGLDTSKYRFKATIQDETLGEVLKMIEISTPLKTKITSRKVSIWAE